MPRACGMISEGEAPRNRGHRFPVTAEPGLIRASLASTARRRRRRPEPR